ncbi:hypothetical protein [Stenotrophomonas indicatrix]|uniref:hypothetical protein n=1 Tax=Stenotrophomonas indicatrix TaxID=2045451 RepID=UPI0028973BCD|nr:hypothetical protein [Stenotrophomonas indicatrix]
MKELSAFEVESVSGGDGMTYTWGKMVGETARSARSARSAWDAMKDYASSMDSSTDVIP